MKVYVTGRIKLEVNLSTIEKCDVDLKEMFKTGILDADCIDISIVDVESCKIIAEERNIPIDIQAEIKKIVAEVLGVAKLVGINQI